MGESYEGSVIESAPGIIEGAPSDYSSESMQSEPIPRETRKPTSRGILSVKVPTSAKVVVNGLATSSEGTSRRYVSHGLKAGHDYRYEVTATIEKDGQPVTLTKTAVLRVGQTALLAFDFDATSDEVVTSLTLKVPSDAKVYLSGKETKADGSVRRFLTTKIEAGSKWEDYTVRVTLDRDGKTLTKERQGSLAGGDQKNLFFDFDQTDLADAR